MCCIAGSQKKEEVEKMLQIMKHRAPDGEGIFNDEKFAIGMGRLAIIDLNSSGLCPLQDDELVLSFNGEIYNYLELRKELEGLGHIFRTNSDSEVLLKSYREWGIKCLDKFNGMFAFAIYDGERIFLARDIAGEKPLYYRNYPFAFASEAKALDWRCEELPAASYLLIEPDNQVTLSRKVVKYWEFKPRQIYVQDAEEELESLLADSVKLRTRSDVPYGLYYSKGIDSSLIETFHDFNYKFTYEDKDFSEEFKTFLPEIVYHLDYPVDSFSAFALYKLAKLASQKVKVVLSGEGADELFGGYIRYIPTAIAFEARKQFPSYSSMFPYTFKDQQFFDKYDPVTAMGLAEFEGNLKTLLRMGDRMGSAFGLENRCPFLDRRIIEFAFSLPPELKISGFETKKILRRILEKRNPEYVHIEKTGLFCNVNKWLGVEQEGFGKESYIKAQENIWKNFQS